MLRNCQSKMRCNAYKFNYGVTMLAHDLDSFCLIRLEILLKIAFVYGSFKQNTTIVLQKLYHAPVCETNIPPH